MLPPCSESADNTTNSEAQQATATTEHRESEDRDSQGMNVVSLQNEVTIPERFPPSYSDLSNNRAHLPESNDIVSAMETIGGVDV